MKKIKISITAVFILFCGLLNAQTISSALGCVKTNFQFYSDTTNLEVTSQFIIKNAGIFKKSVSDGLDYGYGYGGGYESYHLEFITNKELSTEVNRKVNYNYEINFTDSNNIILATTTFDNDKVSHFSNRYFKDTPKFYSFDLINIPISVLDRTRKIYITKIVHK